MDKINKLIIAHDWREILEWAKQLTDEERYEALTYIHNLDLATLMDVPRPNSFEHEYYTALALLTGAANYAKVTCIRCANDLKLVPSNHNKKWTVLHSYFLNPGYYLEELWQYFSLYPPDYLEYVIDYWKNERTSHIHFHLLWDFYKNDLVAFDEETFVRSLFIIPMFFRSTPDDVEFLEKNPEAIDKVLLQFYKYEIPVLDISKWKTYTKDCVCQKCTTYWDEVFQKLIEKGLIKERTIISNLLGTLSYNWKKGHIDWHIRLIKIFEPTREEYLDNQQLLFSAFYTTNNTVGNFVIQVIETIYTDKRFDTETFFRSIPPLFTKEKSDKAILLALDILTSIIQTNPKLSVHAGIVADALVQPSEKIQIKVSRLLHTYIKGEELKELIEPFHDRLKEKARQILQIEKSTMEDEDSLGVDIEFTPLTVPDNWEDLLFHLGRTLKTFNPADIDLFFQGLISLQDQFSENYREQLKPYIKQLSRSTKVVGTEKMIEFYLYEFFENWLSPTEEYYIHEYVKKNHINPIPFFRNRNVRTIDKLRRNDKLSFLSTPTHAPFYIHPDILIERMAEYEQAGEKIDEEDLIIACNRILSFELSDDKKEKLVRMKNKYVGPLKYIFGISNHIEVGEILLPVWTQAARTKDPQGVFREFETTKAKDYPTVVQPFIIDLTTHRRFSEDRKYHWDSVVLENNWNNSLWTKEVKKEFPPLYYYIGYNKKWQKESSYYSRQVVTYTLSLVPRYCDALITALTPVYSDEADESHILQFLIESRLKVHHSGWIYIAVCLVCQDKTTRLLAAEYINLMIGLDPCNTAYISDYIATTIAGRFAPVNRLIEYIDRPATARIKQFQFVFLRKCIEKAEKETLPVNFKKIIAAYREIAILLNRETEEDIENKIVLLTGKKK